MQLDFVLRADEVHSGQVRPTLASEIFLSSTDMGLVATLILNGPGDLIDQGGTELKKGSVMHIKPSLLAGALALQIATPIFAAGCMPGLIFVATQSEKVGGKTSRELSDWPMYGRDLAGSHYNPNENVITPITIKRLKPKWIFETGGDVSSQPTVVAGVVYFGSWDGREYAVDAKTGKRIWAFNANNPSRGGAACADGAVYFGDLGGLLYALDVKTGAIKWKVKIDSHPTTIATSSPIYYKGRIYIGVSSREENAMVENSKYECCSFRGGVAAFDAKTGSLIWRFYTIPELASAKGKDKEGRTVLGPSGAAVWSTVSIHPAASRLYLTTGNQYTNPETNFSDAIIALDLDTGRVIWAYQAKFGDRFTADCARNSSECGPDYDFGTIPLTFRGPNGKQLIGAGQKSGAFYALDPRDGKLVWKTEVGTGRFLGSIVFGNATDGERIYVAISNAYRKIKQGSLAALDGATGKVIWQTLSPDGFSNHGPVTVIGSGAGRLVLAGSTGNFVRAYNAESGEILWEFDTGGAVAGGPVVVEGVLYVGSGFGQFGVGKPNNKLYAFSIDGK